MIETITEMNYRKLKKHLVSQLKIEFKNRGFKRAVLGVSGGLDSSVVMALLIEALGRENLFLYFLPFESTSALSREDVEKLAKTFKVKYTTIEITKQIKAYFGREKNVSKMRIGNKCARERMSILYDMSVKNNALVIGTSNRSEITMGYGTMFGDLACAVNPIGRLYKTQIFEFAKILSIPNSIMMKSPSADLWKGQTDESEMGISYKTIDRISYLIFDKKMSFAKALKDGLSREELQIVTDAWKRSSFKRELPYIIEIPKTIYKGE